MQAVSLLEPSEELVALAGDDLDVIVGERADVSRTFPLELRAPRLLRFLRLLVAWGLFEVLLPLVDDDGLVLLECQGTQGHGNSLLPQEASVGEDSVCRSGLLVEDQVLNGAHVLPGRDIERDAQ